MTHNRTELWDVEIVPICIIVDDENDISIWTRSVLFNPSVCVVSEIGLRGKVFVHISGFKILQISAGSVGVTIVPSATTIYIW